MVLTLLYARGLLGGRQERDPSLPSRMAVNPKIKSVEEPIKSSNYES